MSSGIRIAVFLIFSVLGIAFLSISGVFLYEFQGVNWTNIARIYSHLFLFFPTFGILALCAFYFPACVFLDMYWRHIRFGQARIIIGAIVLAAASYGIAVPLLSGIPAVWQIKPEVLKAEQGDDAISAKPQFSELLPALEATSRVRTVSQVHIGLGPFGRDCSLVKGPGDQQYLPLPDEFTERRFCIPLDRRASGNECCKAQEKFGNYMYKLYEDPESRAVTGMVHEIVLVFIIFFLLVLFVIGLMLVIRRRSLDTHYGGSLNRLERGVLVGAFAMLFWPLSNHAFVQSYAALFGGSSKSLFVLLAPGFSLLFGLWALMLLFFFLRRYKADVEMVGKVAGVIVSGIAFLRYEELVGYFERLAGSGADSLSLGFLGAILLTAFLQLVIWRNYDRELRH